SAVPRVRRARAVGRRGPGRLAVVARQPRAVAPRVHRQARSRYRVRVVVTGAAGFLGSHVADAFVQRDHDVLVYDVAATTRHRSVQGDLADVERLRSAFRGHEVVCHLAAVGDVYLAGKDPALAATVNVTGTA